MIRVTLNDFNLFLASTVGGTRHIKGMRKTGRYGANNAANGWQYNCDGACGEIAVAKWKNVFYDGSIGDFKAKDAGPLQVRTTVREHGHLILHPDDPDDDVFILVLSHASPTFFLCGWTRARDGKKSQYWKEGTRPAFFVPQEDLQPMETLPELHKERAT